ncbi:MAG: DUF2231 domain-containing protein [Pseudomonadota bacterium]|nr:DUF2231 domain-containing protein [Pseudomonadota bacterium]
MSPWPGWHPLVVHFPLALVLVATPLLLAARLLRSEAVASTAAMVGTWNLCLGAIAALFALATGLGAILDLDVGAAARQAISLHMKWAMFSTLALVLLAVWRGAGTAAASRPSWVFVIVLLAAAAALVITGYRGGENVYEFGVGVKKIAVRLEPHGDRRLPMSLLSGQVSREVRDHVGFERSVGLGYAVDLDRCPGGESAGECGQTAGGRDVDRADRQHAVGHVHLINQGGGAAG